MRLLPPIGLEHKSTRPISGELTARPRNQWRLEENNGYIYLDVCYSILSKISATIETTVIIE